MAIRIRQTTAIEMHTDAPTSQEEEEEDGTDVYQEAYPEVAPPTRRVGQVVYVLNCAHCGNFMTNRAMKATLLLQPDFSLYSTDSYPRHCGPREHCELPPEDATSRTCRCLTQSLCCYGCGFTVGYHIVRPCDQCTDMLAKYGKRTNGHRYVFHRAQVCAKERTYVQGETGILSQFLDRQTWSSEGFRRDAVHVRMRANTLCQESDHSLATQPSHIPPDFDITHPFLFHSIREGDRLYWHHLKQHGDLASPVGMCYIWLVFLTYQGLDPRTISMSLPFCQR